MKSPELTEFFSLLGKAKKEKKEEFDNLLKEADINLDVLTSSVVTGIKEAKVNIKKQKKKEEKLIEQLDSIIDVIENPKEVKDITEPAVTVGVPEDFDVSSLEDADDNPSFEVVDLIKPEPIKTPKISDTVAQAIKFIEETNIKEEVENADETSVDNLKAEIKQVRDILYKVLAHGPGSGEVNLLKLDDVDEDSAKVDGKVPQYQASSGKFIGGSASGIGTEDSVNTSGIITASQFSGATASFSGNVDIGGVLTYEDVTNVDSIGLITARNGVVVGSGITLSKDGDVFATGITSSTKVHVGVDTGVYNEDLVVTGDARVTGILTIGTGSIILDPTAKQLRGLEEIVIGIANTITIKQDTKGEIEFTDAKGTPKSVGIGSTVSINTSGIVTATSFVGDLTGDTTGDLTGNVYMSQGFVYSGSTTVTSTSQTAIDTFPAATYRSAKYQVQITRGTEYHITEIYIVHDGTSSYGTEYATIKTGSQLATFDSDINSGNVRLLATPTSSSSTVFKVIATLTKV